MNIEPIELIPGGPTLSRIVAGTMTWGEWGADYSATQMADLIEICLSVGITTFDHADIYGHYTTEATFGKALEELGPEVRGQLELVTKCGINLVTKHRPLNKIKSYDSSRDHILASVDRSLTNLRTEYIDLLLIHRPDPLMDPVEVAQAFMELQESGRVRAFGVSNFTPSQFELLNAAYPLLTNQVECHSLHTAPLFDGTFDQCLAQDIRPMIWSPLGGNKYFKSESTSVLRLRTTVQEIARAHGDVGEDIILLAWLLRHPVGALPVIGTTRKNRLREARLALDVHLTREEWFRILEAGRGFEVA